MEVQQQRPVLLPASRAHGSCRLPQQQDFMASLGASREGAVAVVPPLLCLSQNLTAQNSIPCPGSMGTCTQCDQPGAGRPRGAALGGWQLVSGLRV